MKVRELIEELQKALKLFPECNVVVKNGSENKLNITYLRQDADFIIHINDGAYDLGHKDGYESGYEDGYQSAKDIFN